MLCTISQAVVLIIPILMLLFCINIKEGIESVCGVDAPRLPDHCNASVIIEFQAGKTGKLADGGTSKVRYQVLHHYISMVRFDHDSRRDQGVEMPKVKVCVGPSSVDDAGVGSSAADDVGVGSSAADKVGYMKALGLVVILSKKMYVDNCRRGHQSRLHLEDCTRTTPSQHCHRMQAFANVFCNCVYMIAIERLSVFAPNFRITILNFFVRLHTCA